MSDLSSERWTQIEKILSSALEQPPASRAQFVAEACNGDRELHNEVQSFLEADGEAPSFLMSSALSVAARSLAVEKQSLIGALVGPYRIVKAIGAGGMGEVYLAEDTRLHRSIALKILPLEFAKDPVRIERFEREARAVGALNHPNILVVHDTGIQKGIPYLATEFLEGETLRDQLSRGPISSAKAVDYATQIARGLAAAHEHGVVHRDLKPENIFITSDGHVKILDFGVAKLAPSGVGENALSSLTHAGLIVGTTAYLSPEQVRSQPVGPPADIFAFGSVLYEMLTGERAFAKETQAETMTAILREEPPPSPALAAAAPSLVGALRHCLEKSPNARFQSARDLAFHLESGALPPSAPAATTGSAPTRKRNNVLPWVLAAVSALAALFLAGFLFFRKPAPANVLRFEIPIPGDPITGSPSLAISPDGNHLAFMAMGSKGRPILWTRAMDDVAPHPVPGSEDAQYPFWSPDSRFVAFHGGDQLKAFEVATGGERTICTIRGNVSGAWNRAGVILVANGAGPLSRVNHDGGGLVALTDLDAAHGQRAHFWPSFLPDQRHFLYTVNAGEIDNAAIVVGSLDGGAPKTLISGLVANAMYVPPGYLLYAREGTVFARPFDARRLAFKGAEFQVAGKLRVYYGYTAFSASDTGTFVFRPGEKSRFQLVWFDRAGKRLGPTEQDSERKWSESVLPLSPVLSPDGASLATSQFQPSTGAYGVWVSALTRANVEFPVTDIRNAQSPVWSPDGNSIAYSATPSGGARDLFIKRVDETGHGRLVYHSATDKWPLDWSRDGKTLLFLMNDAQGRAGLWSIALATKPAAAPVPVPGASEGVREASFSPDGRWVAYSAEQFGSSIVYVEDFPAGAARIPISGKGATEPEWSRDGRELFFLSPQDELMAVSISQDSHGSFLAGTPQILFKTSAAGPSRYAVSPDGRRFLVQMPTEEQSQPSIGVVVNRFRSE